MKKKTTLEPKQQRDRHKVDLESPSSWIDILICETIRKNGALYPMGATNTRRGDLDTGTPIKNTEQSGARTTTTEYQTENVRVFMTTKGHEVLRFLGNS